MFILNCLNLKKYYDLPGPENWANIKKWSISTIKATILLGMCCTGAVLANSLHMGLKSAAVGVVAGSIVGNLINKTIEKFKIIETMLDQ